MIAAVQTGTKQNNSRSDSSWLPNILLLGYILVNINIQNITAKKYTCKYHPTNGETDN